MVALLTVPILNIGGKFTYLVLSCQTFCPLKTEAKTLAQLFAFCADVYLVGIINVEKLSEILRKSSFVV